MKAKDYRLRIEAEMQPPADAEAVSPDAGATLVDPGESERWPLLIERLADSSAPAQERLAALKTLQAATFLGDAFDSCRAAYVAALRTAATDADAELRRRALDVLASMKDEFARDRILAGLTGAATPLVSAAVALGLLARDDHASASQIALDFLDRSDDRFTRAQAVRLLSSNAGAKQVFERLMASKSEFREVRQASAAALRNLDRPAFVAKAREILQDPSDFRDIHATLRGAFDRAGIPLPEPQARRAEGALSRTFARLRSLFGNRERP
jgi:hypothetical protein